MTEKVVLTKEQAKAIEKFQKTVHELGISSDELKVIFESGYEVKPEFKVGDWVYDIQHNKVARIDHRGVDDNRVWVDDEDFNFFAIVNIRHATPEEIAEEKERRLFAEHGRKKWELKRGDILIDESGHTRIVRGSTDAHGFLDENKVHFMDGDWEIFEYVKKIYKVACFAENRLDVKKDD